jgi:hypothetical protein
VVVITMVVVMMMVVVIAADVGTGFGNWCIWFGCCSGGK